MLDFHVTVGPNLGRLFYAQPADANHVLTAIKDVQQFYQDSFANLLWVMGIIISVGFLLVGVVMPLVLQWLQSRSFNKIEQKLLEEIAAAKAASSKELDSKVADVKTEFVEIAEKLKQKAKEDISRLFADVLLSNAANLGFSAPAQGELIVMQALRAADRFAKLRDEKKTEQAIAIAESSSENMVQNLKTLPLKIRKESVSILLEDCDSLLESLKNKNHKLEYTERILAIKNTISSKVNLQS